MVEKKKEVTVEVQGRMPTEIISEAITKGANLEQLEKLLTLQERFEANMARKAYHQAMADFKVDPPKIDKDKTVAYGNTQYNHASLANVTEKINEALSKCGLSASWSNKQNGAISVTCKITHIKGHSEETTLSAGPDSSGSKNSIQAIGSTITYLQRYTLLALTGLATYDQDDDGKASSGPVEYITEDQVTQIKDLAVELEVTKDGFLKFMGVDKLEDIKATDYKKAIGVFDAKRERIAGRRAGQK